MSRFNMILELYGEEYVLRQLAEECNELAQAALKLIRVWRHETPMREDEARERLVEEIADVHLMGGVVFRHILSAAEQECADEICEQKRERMFSRLLDGKMESDMW